MSLMFLYQVENVRLQIILIGCTLMLLGNFLGEKVLIINLKSTLHR